MSRYVCRDVLEVMSAQRNNKSEVLEAKAPLKDVPTVLDMKCNILQCAENPYEVDIKSNLVHGHMGEDKSSPEGT